MYFFLCMSLTAAGQRFVCDGQLLVATHDGYSTTLSRPVYVPFGRPYLSAFASYSGSQFDALGFNAVDNYIYAVQEKTNAIVRLKRDNSYDTIGIVSVVDTLQVNAGDCTADGLYICFEQALDQILVFQVIDEFKLLQSIDLYWDPESDNSGPFKASLFDLAIDPNNPVAAYALLGSEDHDDLLPEPSHGFLLRINLDFDDAQLGMVTPVTAVDPAQLAHAGALLFSAQSDLYAYGTSESGLNPPQDKMVSINPFSGAVSELLQGPSAVQSDGCSCPYSFAFSNRTPNEGMSCTGDLKPFILTIVNNSYNKLENLTLIDTFPEGVVIEEVNGILLDNVSEINGIGTNVLDISGLDILAKSTLEIIVKVRSVDVSAGATYNQAFLKNLPERFGGVMPSDDLATAGKQGDASLFYVTAINLKEVNWEAVSPTDCVRADDGQITIISDLFVAGEAYEIKIRNKMGWAETTYQVTADQNQSCELDSLIPGEYQVFQVKSIFDNCGLAIKDFSILLEPPNHLLDLAISSPSPICTAQEIILNSSSETATNIRWTGPRLFGSAEQDPIIRNASPENSGAYMITAEYGYCKMQDTLEVIVKPTINTAIIGDTQYCERDSLLLHATSQEEELSYVWSGPNQVNASSASMIIPKITAGEAGYYEVISTNGACNDTAGIEITILPTPRISMPPYLETDFCDQPVLQASVTGDPDVSYRWLPSEGLGCADCPAPLLEPIVQPVYQLYVENEYACADSAEAAVTLQKEKLIYIPTVFAAGSAGENAAFGLFSGCAVLHIHELAIFDRWGMAVYSASSIPLDEATHAWDGYVNGTMADTGVYTWTATIELVDGSREKLQGDVTLLRSK